VPGHLKMESLFNKPFDLLHFAIFKIFCLATITADQMMMVLAISIRKFITSPLWDMVHFSQHPHPAEQLYGSIDGNQIGTVIRNPPMNLRSG